MVIDRYNNSYDFTFRGRTYGTYCKTVPALSLSLQTTFGFDFVLRERRGGRTLYIVCPWLADNVRRGKTSRIGRFEMVVKVVSRDYVLVPFSYIKNPLTVIIVALLSGRVIRNRTDLRPKKTTCRIFEHGYEHCIVRLQKKLKTERTIRQLLPYSARCAPHSILSKIIIIVYWVEFRT